VRVIGKARRGWLAWTAGALLLAAPAGAVSFDTLVSIGDSLTKAQTNAFPLVAGQLGVPLHNLAVNGATTTTLVRDQLDPAVALDPTFAFIWIGGNDIKNDPLAFAQRRFDPWIANFETALDALLGTGADVVTANLFDVGLTPWVYGLNPDLTPEALASLDELTRAWNARVEASAAARGVPVVDVYTLFERMASGEIRVGGQEFILAPDRGVGMHLFADTQHPSLVARAIIANEIIATLDDSYGLTTPLISEARLAAIAGVAVPEPATATLLGLGLGALARRRRSGPRPPLLLCCGPRPRCWNG
jgi:phospholipase/lecithinase/hemolysin